MQCKSAELAFHRLKMWLRPPNCAGVVLAVHAAPVKPPTFITTERMTARQKWIPFTQISKIKWANVPIFKV